MTDLNTVADQTNDQNDDTNGDNQDLTNDKRFNDFIKEARGYGKDTALGADALPKLAISVVRAAKDGILDLDANKDCLKQVYGAYWSQRSNKRYSIHAQGKESQGAQVSKIKQHYLLGKNELFDGEELMDRAVKMYHDKLTSSETKLKPVYAAYTDVARMANDWKATNGATAPSDEEIEACFYPKEKQEKTLTDIIEKVLKELDKVITGTREDGISSQDSEITDAAESLQRFLAKMTLAAELDAFRAQSAKLAAAGLI
jgi:hypothetical protein